MSERRFFRSMLGLVLLLFLMPLCLGHASEAKGAASIERISPEEARSRVLAGEALLVCSYSDKKCGNLLLEKAILRSDFEQRLSSLPKTQMIIFYCA